MAETYVLDISAMAAETALSTADARDNLSEVINRAAFGKERVVLTRRGKPVVAVVPIEDVALLEALEDQRDAQEIRERLAEWREAGEPTISFDEVKRSLKL